MASSLKCLALLRGNYGNRFELNEFTESAWDAVLGDLDEREVMAAALAWIRAGNEFPPDAGQIAKEVMSSRMPALKMSASEAWSKATTPGGLPAAVALLSSSVEVGDLGYLYRPSSEMDPMNHQAAFKRFQDAWNGLMATPNRIPAVLQVEQRRAAYLSEPNERRGELADSSRVERANFDLGLVV